MKLSLLGKMIQLKIRKNDCLYYTVCKLNWSLLDRKLQPFPNYYQLLNIQYIHYGVSQFFGD